MFFFAGARGPQTFWELSGTCDPSLSAPSSYFGHFLWQPALHGELHDDRACFQLICLATRQLNEMAQIVFKMIKRLNISRPATCQDKHFKTDLSVKNMYKTNILK